MAKKASKVVDADPNEMVGTPGPAVCACGQVVEAHYHLPEGTPVLWGTEAALLDEGVQLPAGAIIVWEAAV